jgi:hypothetical protein
VRAKNDGCDSQENDGSHQAILSEELKRGGLSYKGYMAVGTVADCPFPKKRKAEVLGKEALECGCSTHQI